MKRRVFLKLLASSSGGMLLGLRVAMADDVALRLLGDNYSQLSAYVRIEVDGRIIMGARTPDMGQGTHTIEARIIADELDADWSQVTVIGLPLQVTDNNGKPRFPLAPQACPGSTTTINAWRDLRQVGASARGQLLAAAARQWKLPVSTLRSENSKVIAPDGRTFGFGELAAAAANIKLPSTPAQLKPANQYALIGVAAGDVDAEAIVRGKLRYTVDRWQGDALVAVLARCPYLDGSIDHVDDSLTLQVPGVVKTITLPAPDKDAILGTRPQCAAVAVLAQNSWAALRGRDVLNVSWKQGRFADQSSNAMEKQARKQLQQPETGLEIRSDGDLQKTAKGAYRTVEASYHLPFLAHVSMEPLACLVNLTDKRARLEAPTQDPAAAYAVVAALTGLKPGQIDIRMPRMGGGFGRRLDSDHIAEAVLVAQAAGRPIRLMWTRADTLQHDVYRPLSVQRLQAWLDKRGRILGWQHQLASTPRAARRGVADKDLWRGELYPDELPAGLIDNYRFAWHRIDTAVACGNWRAPGHNTSAFARECFLDEIAHAVHGDPLQLRLDLLGEPRQLPYRGFGGPVLDTGRMAAVLQKAAELIGWKQRLNKLRGLGLACHYTFGSYCAHAFEVSVKGDRLYIHRVICVADVGRMINPLGVEAQMTGGTMDGISAALHQAITVDQGHVQERDLKHYRLARNSELPRKVEVTLMPSQAASSGASEAGLPSVAPALANAVFDATTVRIHRLPLIPELNRLL